MMNPWKSFRSVVTFRRPTLSAESRRLSRSANIEDLRRLAQKRLPRGVFDYIDGGADDELTLSRNVNSFQRLEFIPRVLRKVRDVDTAIQLLGRQYDLPIILAPTGFTRISYSEGELAVARVARRFNIPYTLSTMSTRSIEEVRAVSDGDLWFQVYAWSDKGLVEEMLARATASGYSTIVLTVDTPVLGRRERDVRRGFTMPPTIGPGTLLDGLRHPGWTWDFLTHEPIKFANIVGRTSGDGADPVTLSEFIKSQFDANLSWDDISWFRDRWPGPIVLKGIQSVEDADMAVDYGADAIAVSNHGGRQLDGAPPAIELVAPVVAAVKDRIPVICDGGIRRGSDIVKALALGASACMVGRAYLYGLGAARERGVEHALTLLSEGTKQALALNGHTSVDVPSDLVRWRTSL